MAQVHSLQIEDVHSQVFPANENTRESRYGDPRRRDVSCTFRPILRLMKLTGEFYGDVTMDEVLPVDWSLFSRFYCGVVLLGQWFVVVQAVTSLFFEGVAQINTFFLLLIFSIWYLQTAIVNTICLFSLPKAQKNTSRLGQFMGNLLSTTSDLGLKTCNMYKVHLLLALVCLFALFNTICLTLLDLYRNSSIGRFRPWNGLLVYRLIHLIFCAFDAFAWVLPPILFYVSCKLLVGFFENLEKKITTLSPDVLRIESLRKEHSKLCETVALADKLFSPLMLASVGLDIPIICINFYQLVKSPASSKEDITFVVTILYWCITVTVKIVFVMMSGARVNEKVRNQFDAIVFLKASEPTMNTIPFFFYMNIFSSGLLALSNGISYTFREFSGKQN